MKRALLALLFVATLVAALWSYTNSAKHRKTTVPGMVWIPGGEFEMGTDHPSMPDAKPVHAVRVSGFYMDETEVTNDQFAEYVKATRYVTVAEQTPRAEDFPNAPKENLVAGSVVFRPPVAPVGLDDHFQWWAYVSGANWRHPDGPNSTIDGKGNVPVVHVAWPDAVAYATWAGKRLPTEAEFEYAARGGLRGKPYVWGDEFCPGNKYQANTFQGNFPNADTGKDGFRGVAPVRSFLPNGYGLFDMAGNVWEWTSDWYRPDTFKVQAALRKVADNPKGPDSSYDPAEPQQPKRVMKGGSFLCTDQYCSRYMPGGRGKGDPMTGTNHVGFRCVRDGD